MVLRSLLPLWKRRPRRDDASQSTTHRPGGGAPTKDKPASPRGRGSHKRQARIAPGAGLLQRQDRIVPGGGAPTMRHTRRASHRLGGRTYTQRRNRRGWRFYKLQRRTISVVGALWFMV